MSDDFEGKVHDLEAADQEERSDGENEDQEDELDRQMGEVDGDDTEKLDDQMWGSDEEEEGEDQGVSLSDMECSKNSYKMANYNRNRSFLYHFDYAMSNRLSFFFEVAE